MEATEMLRGIFAGLKRAFSWGLGAIDWVITLPFRLFQGAAAADLPGIRPLAPMPRMAESGLTAEDLAEATKRNAAVVMNYLCDVMQGLPTPVPDRLPRLVKKWLPGLRTNEIVALVMADQARVAEHLAGSHLVDGVPRVCELPPVERDPVPDAGVELRLEGFEPEQALALMAR
jgi:hypothetical protein